MSVFYFYFSFLSCIYQCWACRGLGEDANVSFIKKINEAAAKELGVNTFRFFFIMNLQGVIKNVNEAAAKVLGVNTLEGFCS